MDNKEQLHNTALKYEQELENWIDRKRAAVKLINSISTLLYDKSIELVLFRNVIVDQSVSEILRLHKYAKEVVNKPINVYDSAELAQIISEMDLAQSKIDIGKLAYEWQEVQGNFADKHAFLADKLSGFTQQEADTVVPKDVVLYGFGRIGRLAARELIKNTGKGQQLRLRAIVTRSNTDHDIIKRASLLRTDSVHGPFLGTIIEDLENKALVINGQIVHMIQANNPDTVDYKSFGINNALVIDNTGVFRDKEALGLHLKSNGVGNVLLTAPGKEMPNVVYGVNHLDLDVENDTLVSAASCTTNAIVPVLKVINDHLDIQKGHIETIHAYTNDQNLLDNMHKKIS